MKLLKPLIASAGLLLGVSSSQASFAFHSQDLMLTLYTDSSGSQVNLVADIGSAETLISQALSQPGTSVTLGGFNSTQYSTATAGAAHVTWAVMGGKEPGDSVGNYPLRTLWITSPRSTFGVQTSPWIRKSAITQGAILGQIFGVANDLTSWSSGTPADSITNSGTAVIINSGDPNSYTSVNGNAGNIGGTFGQGDVENTFAVTTAVDSQSDLFQISPGTGSSVYLGYFDLSPSGVLTFTSTGAAIPPSINSQPASQTVAAGSTVNFSVSAFGSAAAYQWALNGTPLSDNGTTIIGSLTAALTITNAVDADDGSYTVTLSNASGTNTSSAAVLTVVDLPVISAQPLSYTNANVPQGTNINFSVTATGLFLSYQWSFGGSPISGATTSAYATTAQATNEGTYTVVVSNTAGPVTSSNALFTSTIKLDTTKPTLTVTAPSANISTTNSVYTLAGTASDNSHLVGVFYMLNGGTCIATTLTPGTGTTFHWSAGIALVPGTNTVVIYSKDLAGNTNGVTRTINYIPQSGISLTIVGSGRLTTNWTGSSLSIGKSYTITAVPAAGYIFSNWTGTISSIVAKQIFVMQTNETLTATFVANPFIATAGAYNGLFFETNVVTHQSAGFFNATVTSNLTYSGKLLLQGASIAISGSFNADGTATKVLTRAGQSNVTLNLAMDFADEQLNGTVSSLIDGTPWVATLISDKAVFKNSNLAPTNYTGTSTFLIPGLVDPTVGPTGYGYGLVTVSSNGSIVLSGGTADGLALAQTVPVSKDGNWPLYVSLYGGNGEALGWLNVNSNMPAGDLSLIKTGWTNAIYASGFTNQTTILGSTFVAPTEETILTFTEGLGNLYFNNGNLTVAESEDVLLAYNNVVYTADATTKVAFNKKTGLFSGSFFNTGTGTTNKFSGAVLQNLNFAGGSFTGSTEDGSVYLQQGE